MLGVATRTRRIVRNPLDAVEPPKGGSDVEMRFIDHGEVARLAMLWASVARPSSSSPPIAGSAGVSCGDCGNETST
jgi:hypothetical protein